MNCTYCQSNNIVSNIKVYGYQNSGVTLPHTVTNSFNFDKIANELLLAELCQNCGTIVRFYVKNPNRNWDYDKFNFNKYDE